MWTHVHKDWKRMVKDRKALIIVILMPALLTVLLGLSIGKMMNGSEEIENIPIGVIDQSSPASWNVEGEGERAKEVSNLSSAPNDFVALFKDDILKGEELSTLIEVKELDSMESGKRLIDSGELNSVISFPSTFNQDVVDALLFSKERDITIDVWQNPDQALQSDIVASIVESYTNLLTSLVIQKEGVMHFLPKEDLTLTVMATKMQGLFNNGEKGNNTISLTRDSVKGLKAVTGIQYYTVGMAVMFMLYVATYSAIYSKDEIRTNTFSRLQVMGVSPFIVLVGKLLSTSLVVFVQFIILFGVSKLLFGITLGSILPLLVLMISASITVGCLAVAFSVLTLTYKESRLTDLFQSVVIPFMAMFGGSFIQLSIMPESVRFVGETILNGAALDGFLKIMQGYGLESLQGSLIALFVNAIIFLLVALFFIRRNKEVFS
ncbi:ABC transporter permease [Pontibacillus sp. ALD_SL1]|uniref:ABC transporter permease n=1 Tax=Pontibacillus sp. ALD_SL1 TaxID=2777185 RepID=UPI001A9766EF|nr:ABC transporter permease [Pontibacillus sp. ALD_SL1]QST01698.1 ABC transporter permease [Pontibacillus sp. ALD_SL1]